MDYSNRKEVEDKGADILSYKKRKNSIHILTADAILAEDIFQRIHDDFRMDHFDLITPKKGSAKDVSIEINQTAADTIKSRILIIDVRHCTLAVMQQAYNKIVGYNRKDLNKACYTILIGDGPFDLFSRGDNLDSFIALLGKHRVDYHPAAFFFDPFIHYEDEEIDSQAALNFTLQTNVPKRLLPYFSNKDKISVENIRKFFRAAGASKEVKEKRLKILRGLFTKRIADQYPSYKEKTEALLSKDGVVLATEKLNLYPFGFEDLVYELMQKAAQ